jgi:hypothetical protein
MSIELEKMFKIFNYNTILYTRVIKTYSLESLLLIGNRIKGFSAFIP